MKNIFSVTECCVNIFVLDLTLLTHIHCSVTILWVEAWCDVVSLGKYDT